MNAAGPYHASSSTSPARYLVSKRYREGGSGSEMNLAAGLHARADSCAPAASPPVCPLPHSRPHSRLAAATPRAAAVGTVSLHLWAHAAHEGGPTLYTLHTGGKRREPPKPPYGRRREERERETAIPPRARSSSDLAHLPPMLRKRRPLRLERDREAERESGSQRPRTLSTRGRQPTPSPPDLGHPGQQCGDSVYTLPALPGTSRYI